MSTATAAVPALTRPAVGDRVEVDVTIMGETFGVEVEVVQVDDDGPRGVRIIGRPEGSLVTAYARHTWRPIAAHTGQHLQGCVSCYAAAEEVGR